jgi:hypothetical protein
MSSGLLQLKQVAYGSASDRNENDACHDHRYGEHLDPERTPFDDAMDHLDDFGVHGAVLPG